MDARTRHAIADRDRALSRVNRLTWHAGTLAAAGAVLLGAGFAHLLPTHLPPDSGNSGPPTSGTGGGTSGSSTGGGFPAPATPPAAGSGAPSHVTSGGS